MSKHRQKIIAITGPSSSGKTRLAIETALELDGEVISVDSRQIYKGLDIGSAKPTIEERCGIKHHLLDIIEPTVDYTVANFCDDAKKAIKEITDKGKVPVLAGGTGLYFRVLLQDFDLPRVPPDKTLRNNLEKKSAQELYNMLLNIDFETAQKIHCNNKVKVIRALEVCITLGVPMSKAQKKKENMPDVIWSGLNFENRETLYNRINKRVDMMFETGLEEEAEALFQKYPDNHILQNTIGYSEFVPYYSGLCNISEVKDKIKQNTRRYAKRQISWFNANKDTLVFDPEQKDLNQIKNTIVDLYLNSQ